MSDSNSKKKVMFIGQEPDTVDYTDPSLPPGIDAAKISAGIALAMKQMADRGWDADLCLVRPDDSAAVAVERQLATKPYDVVVIGGGLRIPPKTLLLFEVLINTIHHGAPQAHIAFNTRPDGTADAAARWLGA
jgi:hypothetical protein